MKISDQRVKCFGECNHIKSHANGLAQIECYADGRANVDPEGTADDVVGPAPLNLLVGSNFGHRHGSGDGNHMSQEYDPYDPQKSKMAYGIAKSQKENGPKNGRDSGHEDRQGTKLGCGSMQMRIRHAFFTA